MEEQKKKAEEILKEKMLRFAENEEFELNRYGEILQQNGWK